MISGVVSGFLGSLSGGLTFISCYNYMSLKMYTDPAYQNLNFKLKNILIYICSDFFASFSKIFFEARKQII